MGRLTRKTKRRLRVEKASQGRGSAEQFVRKQFPRELAAYRRRRNRVSVALVVMLDGDVAGVAGRLAELDAACAKQATPARRSDEDAFVFVPTWWIETWLAWLDGKTGEAIDENKNDYPRLPREGLPTARKGARRHVQEPAVPGFRPSVAGRGLHGVRPLESK